jgi:hypothetical protein
MDAIILGLSYWELQSEPMSTDGFESKIRIKA